MQKILPLALVRAAGLPIQPLLALGFDCSKALQRCQESTLETERTEQAMLAWLSHLLQILPENRLRTEALNARRSLFQGKPVQWRRMAAALETQGDASLWTEFSSLLDALENARTAQASALQVLENQWRTVLDGNFAALQTVATSEVLQRGLLFASHDLLRQLPRFQATPLGQFSKKDRGTALAVYQYLARAAAKTSPLAHFTTLDLLRFDEAEQAAPAPTFSKIAVAPNAAILEALNELLLGSATFRQHLFLRLNPFIVKQLGVYEFLYFDGERESLQRLGATPLLDFVLKIMLENERKIPFSSLQNLLSEAVDAPLEHLEQHLLELAEIGFLEWEWPEKGWAANWAAGLMNFLGHLPAEPLVAETAALLQWLRGTARALPFQDAEDAMQTQRETARLLQAHFEKFGATAPPLPPERIFYADVAAPTDLDDAEKTTTAGLLRAFQDAVSAWLPAPEKGRAEAPSGGVPLASFFKTWQAQKIENQSVGSNFRANPLAETARLGLLFQPFRAADGRLCAVLNAWHPGGGKMFGRWLSLFSETAERELQAWLLETNPAGETTASFAAQGWHNANFHPVLHETALEWTGGRSRNMARNLLPGALEVAQTGARNCLFDPESKRCVRLVDLGLEAWATRSPMSRMLLELGTPQVSLRETLAQMSVWQEIETGVKTRGRIEREGWVFARKSWRIAAVVWREWLPELGAPKCTFFLKINVLRENMAVPRWVFFAFTGSGQKPQYLDFHSPVSVLHFEKTLRNAGDWPLELTEMLPAPEQLLAGRAREFAVELA